MIKNKLKTLSKPKTLRNVLGRTLRHLKNTYKTKRTLKKILKTEFVKNIQQSLNTIHPTMTKYRGYLEEVKKNKKLSSDDVKTIVKVVRNPYSPKENYDEYQKLINDKKLTQNDITTVNEADYYIKEQYDQYHKLKTLQYAMKKKKEVSPSMLQRLINVLREAFRRKPKTKKIIPSRPVRKVQTIKQKKPLTLAEKYEDYNNEGLKKRKKNLESSLNAVETEKTLPPNYEHGFMYKMSDHNIKNIHNEINNIEKVLANRKSLWGKTKRFLRKYTN